MVSETQDMSYLDKKQKEDLQRLKQFQSIDSEIFPDRVLEKQDRLRYFYLSEIELERVKIDQKIVVREKDEALLRRLKPQVDAEGLIEPLTVEDLGNNQFLLLAGQHRYHVLRELDIERAPAKIYLQLEPHEQLTLGYMSNEARKNPPAGRRYGSLTGQFIEIKNKLQEELGREPAEFDVINEMYMAKNLTNKNKLRALQTKEILFSILLENIKYNPDSIVNQYKFISDAQVPKTRINTIMQNYQKNNENLELWVNELHGKLRYLIFNQTYENIPVWNARLDFRYRLNGDLVMIGHDAYPDLNVNINPTLDEEEAIFNAKMHVGFDETLEDEIVNMPELYVWVKKNETSIYHFPIIFYIISIFWARFSAL